MSARDVPPPERWGQLLTVAGSCALALTLWFSASSVVPQLARLWNLGEGERAALTLAVQIGFVAGALASAVFNLADRISARALFGVSALLGAAANALIAWLDAGLVATLVLRFGTGVCLAGVYPPGMKLIATWFKRDRGLGIGALIGTLTLGSALPHLLNALADRGGGGMPPWQHVIYIASGLAALGGLWVAVAARNGPYHVPGAQFDWGAARRVLSYRPTRLANFGYLGHMWELYAMWTWLPICLLGSYEAAGRDPVEARVFGFGVIAIGAPGALLAGWLADRWGRTRTTIVSLVVSGACCLVAGFLVPYPLVLALLGLLWGFAAIADSGQFSAAVSELTDPRYVGTALTVQTCLGFLLTAVSIWLVPPLVVRWGWPVAFAMLALGPVFGIVSMARLRGLPEAVRMASGNR